MTQNCREMLLMLKSEFIFASLNMLSLSTIQLRRDSRRGEIIIFFDYCDEGKKLVPHININEGKI